MTQPYPQPVVGALILNNNKLFLMKSHKWNNKWVIPGGRVELGENLNTALTREIKEETSLDINEIEFLGFFEFIFDECYWKKKHFIFFDFVCKTNSTNVILNEEAQEFKWVLLKNALEMDLEPYTRKSIKMLMNKV